MQTAYLTREQRAAILTAAFILESYAHMNGQERVILPIADLLRSIQPVLRPRLNDHADLI